MSLQVSANAQIFLLTNARETAFAASTRTILARLGYVILDRDAVADATTEGGRQRPDLVLADENRLHELADIIDDPDIPVVLITGRRGIREERSNVIAAVKRPAGLHDLYRILQQHLEQTPRSVPRVSTNLEARCRRKGRSWTANVLSLSENGCLLRSAEPIPLGSILDLRLRLPAVGVVDIKAETAYQMVPDLGLVFSAVPAKVRESLENYVADVLAPA